jgi:hypothetical protein
LGAVKAENFLIAELLLTPKLVLFCMEFACLLFMLWIACQWRFPRITDPSAFHMNN